MKTIATIQYVIAWICVLVFALPSLYVFGMGIESFSKQLEAALYVLGTVGVWLCGLWLLRGYGRIMAGGLGATEMRNVWLTSLAFNAIGLFVGAIGVSDERSLEAYLVLMPALTGTVLALIALLLPADHRSRLEINTHVNF
jgi:hypothetical protein